jgi:hypothetical protein
LTANETQDVLLILIGAMFLGKTYKQKNKNVFFCILSVETFLQWKKSKKIVIYYLGATGIWPDTAENCVWQSMRLYKQK